jgi:cytochrome subunit of sulfide dehydrogenase
MLIRNAIFILNFLIAGAAFGAPLSAEELAKPCAECHGVTGVSTMAQTPHLNGQVADYLEQEIGGLANGARKTGVPNHVVPTWGAKEISAISKFYAGIKAMRPKQDIDAQKVAKGAEIYNKRCAECHADNGRESDKDAPLLAAQNLDYMLAQTKLFVSGKRRFPFMMDDAYRGLTLEDLDSVTHFFASQEQVRPRK